MFKNTAEYLSKSLVTNGIITADQKDLYFVGYQCGLTVLVNILFVLAIGFLLSIFSLSMVFIIAFYLLRICAGGFHVKGIVSCFWISCILETTALFGIRLLPLESYPLILIMAVAMYIVCGLLCPVPSKKLLCTKKEIIFRRKLCLTVFTAQLIVLLVLRATGFTFFTTAIIYAWTLYGLLNILGHIQNTLENR